MANSKSCLSGNHKIPCPFKELLNRLADKWSILIIVTLADAPEGRYRFSELQKQIDGVSQRMLTATLRNLERDGLVARHIFPEVPPRVEYELTELGKGILVPMNALVKWVEVHWPEIQTAREKYDISLDS